jgi:endonuclease-3 related protein
MITILILHAIGGGWQARQAGVSSPPTMSETRLRDLYDRLHTAYGPQDWWPAGDPFEMIVGAVLTQRTGWRNAELALHGLSESGLLRARALHDAPVERIAEAIRAAGFYRVKARKLKAFASFLIDRHDGDLDKLFALPTDELRGALLGLFGIGEETADAILVYAAERPAFVVDAYARRLLGRFGWIDGGEPYGELRRLFLDALPKDARLLGEFHALIVRHGKAHCRSNPVCEGCSVAQLCATGSAAAAVREANP